MKIRYRLIFLISLLLFVFSIFTYQLVRLQLISGKTYLEKAEKLSVRRMTVEAARGEILDRYGRPLAVNRVGYSVIFDKVFLPDDRLNDTIDKLITLLKQSKESWIDNLPITKKQPFEFSKDSADEILRLKKRLNLNHYATAQNCVDAMTEKFGLQDYDIVKAREIMGVRYEMLQKDYSITINYTFATDISEKTIAIIKENSFMLPGVDIQVTPIREYLVGTVAPHIVGTVGPIYSDEFEALKDKGYKLSDVIGKNGIEKALEDKLKGTDGVRIIEQNSRGIVTKTETAVEPKPGNTVSLTLDKKLQETSQNLLEKYIKNLNETAKAGEGRDAKAGAAVVLDVNSGEILAAATYPSYDIETYQNDYQSIKYQKNSPLFNRAINGSYRPGSTFKPAVGLAGLTTGVIEKDSTVTCKHQYTYFSDITFTCLGYHGNISIVRALDVSCNIFFYDVGRRVGIEKLNQYCKSLGLGVKTGVEIPESEGILDGKEYRQSIGKVWNPGDVVQCSIGQAENKFSPLQLATYAATIANKGTRYKTHLVKSVNSYGSDEVIEEIKPVVAEKVDIPESAFDTVSQGMYQVTHNGTGAPVFANYYIEVAGKTGTAQVGSGSENVLFVCYAPYDDPEIAIAVVLENGGFSRHTCYLAKEIIEAYFTYQGEEYKAAPTGQLLP